MIKSSTVLISMELDNKLYFAADKRVSWSYSQAAISPTSKVSKRNDVLLAGTGDASLCFEIVHRGQFPVYHKGDADHFVFNEFLPHLIGDLRGKGLVDEKERRLVSRQGSKHASFASILIGLKDNMGVMSVYEIDFSMDDISAVRVPTIHAHGCGGSYALAVVQLLLSQAKSGKTQNYKKLNLKPKDILMEAVRITAINSPGCDDNMDIEVL